MIKSCILLSRYQLCHLAAMKSQTRVVSISLAFLDWNFNLHWREEFTTRDDARMKMCKNTVTSSVHVGILSNRVAQPDFHRRTKILFSTLAVRKADKLATYERARVKRHTCRIVRHVCLRGCSKFSDTVQSKRYLTTTRRPNNLSKFIFLKEPTRFHQAG